ncbi:hypothetical protein BKA82DRAFT_948775 [Pisolithus tinctorius]|uniref:RING-type E3 ubiquitin transferase n=1 Tax=Pisolithus tinctorius Marx 270 TaxID=870435 RepID=A0A0C3PCG9_PISTI|nr:hypothetical protein BKA82DRAFT_948775 [Pisolithus tinctorius]KIO05409.1 hypothetical protein M404DRAFT_948775 [Pisolithus tinctorius Marx 270]
MARLFVLIFLLAFLCSVRAHSQRSAIINKFSATSAEGSWLWGWVWGVESSVSVVDRSPPVTYHSRPASFGLELKDPLLGYVIPLSSFTVSCPTNDTSIKAEPPNSGCPPLCPSGDRHPDPTESWIALVQRGQCPFVDKIRESQRLGARAVVVGGEDPDVSGISDTLISMYSKEDASDVTIPSTYIRYADYQELIVLIGSSTTSHAGLKTLSLLITAEYPAWEWYSPILTFVIILFLPSCLTFVTLLIHRVRIARAALRDRAPEHLVKSLPWRVWNGTTWEKHEGSVPHLTALSSSTVDLESGASHSASSHEAVEDAHIPWYETQIECAICISGFSKGDRVRELPCHHIFHLEEIDNWLINLKKVCPVCKADVTQPWNTSKLPSSSAVVTEGEDAVDPAPPTEHTPLLPSRDRVVSS